MESIEKEYNAIVDVLNGYVDEWNKEQELFKKLNDVYETMLQGYMIVLNEDDESSSVVDELPEGLEEATLEDVETVDVAIDEVDNTVE